MIRTVDKTFSRLLSCDYKGPQLNSPNKVLSTIDSTVKAFSVLMIRTVTVY